MEIKRILRYLKENEDYGLWYKFEGNLDLKVFTNADWAGSIDDKKSTSGGAFFLGTSQSIVEAKYVSLAMNYSNIIWFKQLLEGMKVEIKEPIVMFVIIQVQLTFQRIQ